MPNDAEIIARDVEALYKTPESPARDKLMEEALSKLKSHSGDISFIAKVDDILHKDLPQLDLVGFADKDKKSLVLEDRSANQDKLVKIDNSGTRTQTSSVDLFTGEEVTDLSLVRAETHEAQLMKAWINKDFERAKKELFAERDEVNKYWADHPTDDPAELDRRKRIVFQNNYILMLLRNEIPWSPGGRKAVPDQPLDPPPAPHPTAPIPVPHPGDWY